MKFGIKSWGSGYFGKSAPAKAGAPDIAVILWRGTAVSR